MAKKERRLFRIILHHFFKSLTPKIPKHTCVGEDFFGTKYYEIERTESVHKKPNRYFVPVNKNDFDQELPAEWEAWLRNRRAVPPSPEEVNANQEMIVIKRKNAAEIDAKFAPKVVPEAQNPDAKPLSQHSSLGFPSYEEYKHFGQDYKPKT